MDEVVWGFKVFGDNATIYLPTSWLHWSGGECSAIMGAEMQFQSSQSGSPPTSESPETWPLMRTYPENTCMLATPTSGWTSRWPGSGWQTCYNSGLTSPVQGHLVPSSTTLVPWLSSWWWTSIPASTSLIASPGSELSVTLTAGWMPEHYLMDHNRQSLRGSKGAMLP